MVLVMLIEFVLVSLLLLGVVTQVAIPLWQGTELLPFFRVKSQKERQAEREQQRLYELRREAESAREYSDSIARLHPPQDDDSNVEHGPQSGSTGRSISQ